MPELSPTVFGVTVLLLVAALVVVPRLRARSHKPTIHDMYFDDAAGGTTPTHVPTGAPRAVSPTRAAEESGAPEPLKLPF
jgi:hypothetical protein